MALLVRPSAVTKIIQRLDTIKLSKVRPIAAIKTQNVFCRCSHSVAKRNDIGTNTSIFNISGLKGINFHTSCRKMGIVSFKLTDIGEGIREVSVKEWFVKEGDKVEQFDNICEVQSDKASVTITSRYDGIIKKLHYKIDEVALVGQALVDLEVEDNNEAETTPVKTEQPTADTIETVVETKSQTGKALATPAVRRISMQHNVDLLTVKATGRDGRVLKEDILKHINMTSNDSNNVKKEMNMEDVAKIKYEERLVEKIIEAEKMVPITGFTKAMTKTMNLSLKIPHFVYSDEIDVSKLVHLRSDLKADAAARGVALSYMPFLIKAASLALAKFPIINSSVDENCENIIYKSSHNIGVAMDTPKGLIVPNIKNVQQKTILQIAAELNALQTNGAKGVLTTEHLTGATFTLSNIGVIGGTYAKPVIMAPQVSIGAIGKIQVLPRFDKNDNVVKAHVMCVSWSADHRIIDGVTMASFSNEWKYYVENPYHFILDL